MFGPVTHHAAVRMQQRAICLDAVDMLLEFGSAERCRGADRFFFDRAARRDVAESLDELTLRGYERFLNAYAVVADDGSLVTVGWRARRLRRP